MAAVVAVESQPPPSQASYMIMLAWGATPEIVRVIVIDGATMGMTLPATVLEVWLPWLSSSSGSMLASG